MDVSAILQQLTAEEKAALCAGKDFWFLQGVPRLGAPSIMVADGPHGLRKQTSSQGFALGDNVPATCFPTASALASTWNRDLLQAVGAALGEEALAEGVGVVLGPGVNIKRSPLGGRNFEYFSEDPYLSSAMAAAFIQGVQGTGVGASIKHFAVNNQETRRMSIDAQVDERALREIYLASFEQAVKSAQPWTVMAAYNKLNGVACCEHRELLTAIVRDEWGYGGLVLSDWGAVDQRAPALAAGLDLAMPGLPGEAGAEIVQAVRQDRLPQASLDQAARRVLTLIAKAAAQPAGPADGGRCDHHNLARQAASEGAVLLKNTGGALPLARQEAVAVIGALARFPRYQGAGSSQVTPSRLDTAYDGMAQRVGEARLRYATGYHPSDETPDPVLLAEAQQAAQGADVAVVFVGLPAAYETEGVDRDHMRLPPSHNALVEAVAQVAHRVVVVLMNGAPVEMPWHGEVQTILEAYLGGQAGGSAVAQLLYGEVNPSGKLAETFPLRLEDHPAHAFFPGGPQTVEYRESIYVGYRYYDAAQTEVLFPFGHGLSYTRFAYSDLRLSAAAIQDAETLTVAITVANCGDRAGQEVVQLYVRDVQTTVFRPMQELRGFAKAQLLPGKAQTVAFPLDRRSFAYYDTELHDWHVESGTFEIRVGASSRDIRATALVEVQGTRPQQPSGTQRGQLAAYYKPTAHGGWPPEAFAALLGRPRPPNAPKQQGRYTLNTPLADMKGSALAWLLRAVIRRQAERAGPVDANGPAARMAQRVADELPLRMLRMGSNGRITPGMLRGLLLMVNGRPLQGLRALLGALRRPSAR
ncbi:MAG: glycosyl hydrolase [Chloroflexi bacterium]|nr:glycosyl hydrolase [Chloroflexota bacterium]